MFNTWKAYHALSSVKSSKHLGLAGKITTLEELLVADNVGGGHGCGGNSTVNSNGTHDVSGGGRLRCWEDIASEDQFKVRVASMSELPAVDARAGTLHRALQQPGERPPATMAAEVQVPVQVQVQAGKGKVHADDDNNKSTSAEVDTAGKASDNNSAAGKASDNNSTAVEAGEAGEASGSWSFDSDVASRFTEIARQNIPGWVGSD
jgi:hypothetical protein